MKFYRAKFPLVSSVVLWATLAACGMVGSNSATSEMTSEAAKVSEGDKVAEPTVVQDPSDKAGDFSGATFASNASSIRKAAGGDVALAPVPGLQPTDAGVPTGKEKATRVHAHVANLDGVSDASTSDGEANAPCQDEDGKEIPALFQEDARPYVFWQKSSHTGMSLGVQSDVCGRFDFTYSPDIPPDYNPLDPDKSGCSGDAEVWASFESGGIHYQSQKITIPCGPGGEILVKIVLESPSAPQPVERKLPILLRKFPLELAKPAP